MSKTPKENQSLTLSFHFLKGMNVDWISVKSVNDQPCQEVDSSDAGF